MSDAFLCIGGELDGREINARGQSWRSGDGTIYKPHWIQLSPGRKRRLQFLAPEGTTEGEILEALFEHYRQKGRQQRFSPLPRAVRRVAFPSPPLASCT